MRGRQSHWGINKFLCSSYQKTSKKRQSQTANWFHLLLLSEPENRAQWGTALPKKTTRKVWQIHQSVCRLCEYSYRYHSRIFSSIVNELVLILCAASDIKGAIDSKSCLWNEDDEGGKPLVREQEDRLTGIREGHLRAQICWSDVSE